MRAVFLLALLAVATPVRAQHQHPEPPSAAGWSVSASGQAFLTLNLQERKFTDFRQLESQNWVMAVVTRQSTTTRVGFHLMLSAEPFTLRRLGSAQVFQAGETLDGLPLRDYQHPHDLIMGLDARVDRRVSDRASVFASAGLVGSPALGPTAFMHRASATRHPTAPLTHHMIDSTHITHGVVSAGVASGGWTVDGSAFHGREPDEDRVGLDLGSLDSWAVRVSRALGPWRAQVSTARLASPEAAEPGDVTRTTASVEYIRADSALTLAVGRNDRDDHDEWGWLLEAVRPVARDLRVYARAEVVDRFILVDFDHAARTGEERHFLSRIAALTIGADRTLRKGRLGQLAVGADLTVHRTPANLRDSYGTPFSIHVFLRAGR